MPAFFHLNHQRAAKTPGCMRLMTGWLMVRRWQWYILFYIARGIIPGSWVNNSYRLSILLANIKSFLWRPFILCVHKVNFTFPQERYMSGWWLSDSATRPTLLTKSSASWKFLNLKSLSRWCSLTICHSEESCDIKVLSMSPFKGSMPPWHGTHLLFDNELSAITVLSKPKSVWNPNIVSCLFNAITFSV